MLVEKGQTLNRGKNEHVHELQIEIGKAISERRISKGLSIAQVEATTKISQAFIQDIELGKFERLPGKVFGRGFVKNICKCLGMDAGPILEKYEKSWAYIPETVKERSETRSFSFFSTEKGAKISFSPSIFANFSFSRLIIPISILVFVGCFAFLVRYLMKQNSEQPQTAAVTESMAKKETTSTVETPTPATGDDASQLSKSLLPSVLKEEGRDSSAAKLEPVKPAGKKTEEAESKPVEESTPALDNKALLILVVKEETKIKLRVLPEEYTISTFVPGSYKFTFEDRMEIYLFDPSAVEIQFNGKNLGVLGKKGEDRKLSFSAKELTQLPENALEASKESTPPTTSL